MKPCGLTIDPKPLKDHMKADGHKEAFGFVRELVHIDTLMAEHIIQQVYYLVLTDKCEDRIVYYNAFDKHHTKGKVELWKNCLPDTSVHPVSRSHDVEINMEIYQSSHNGTNAKNKGCVPLHEFE